MTNQETENQVLEGDPRTEDEILRGVASVKFGGKTYELKEMKAGTSGPFRRKIGEALAPFVAVMVEDKQANWPKKMVPILFSDGLDQMVDLVFVYDPTLPRDEIMETATEAELIEAAGVVLDLNFPLFESMVTVTMKILSKVDGV